MSDADTRRPERGAELRPRRRAAREAGKWGQMGASADDSTQYDALAELYARHNEDGAWNALYERPGTIALLPPVARRRVLDAGCGTGPLSAWLAAQGADVVGIDSSGAMIRLAQERGLAGASFRVADLARELPFDDDSFDVIVASLALHYVRDWLPTLREFARVLRSDGTVVFSTHHPAMDVHLSLSGNYFETELVEDRLIPHHEDILVRFWRRPLSGMVAAIGSAGFAIDALAEPTPLPECRERDPAAWLRLTTQPQFLFFRLSLA